jgi:phosphoheptose isomerase
VTAPLLSGAAHVRALLDALPRLDTERLDRWGERLADVLVGGGRLLVAGNGGSAAQAQHLTAELVGRYRDDRPALSALALHAETSSLTAIANDYGYDHGYARQVQAHGRPGDVFLGLSTSGRSGNVLAAMSAASAGGLQVWALTGPGPNPMLDAARESVVAEAEATATVQEVHQVAVHLLCAAVDLRVGADRSSSAVPPAAPALDGTLRGRLTRRPLPPLATPDPYPAGL